MSEPRARRTQVERREQSVRKILDAATEMLIEVGYGSTTVQRIAERAGLSQGGLFRHFATREAIMMAVGEDVGRKILEGYRRELEALDDQRAPRLMLTVRLLQATCRSRINQAWLELCHASRTNPALRAALAPVAQRYFDAIVELARELLPELAAGLGDRFPLLVDTAVTLFDGEVMHRGVLENDVVESDRMQMIEALAAFLPGALPTKKKSPTRAAKGAAPAKRASVRH